MTSFLWLLVLGGLGDVAFLLDFLISLSFFGDDDDGLVSLESEEDESRDGEREGERIGVRGKSEGTASPNSAGVSNRTKA